MWPQESDRGVGYSLYWHPTHCPPPFHTPPIPTPHRIIYPYSTEPQLPPYWLYALPRYPATQPPGYPAADPVYPAAPLLIYSATPLLSFPSTRQPGY